MSRTRLLVAVSSPWASERLLPRIVDLAQRLDADTVITHVAHPLGDDESETDAKTRGDETLKLLVEGLADAGIGSQSVMLYSDDIPKALLNTARYQQCTMIIMGLTGKGMLKRLLDGDVPTNLLRQADIPVLIFPSNWVGDI